MSSGHVVDGAVDETGDDTGEDTADDAAPDVAGSTDALSREPLSLFPAEEGFYGDLEPQRPPLIGEDGRVRLSFSAIDKLETCPLQFRYVYLDGLPGQPAPALSFGSSIHAVLEWFYDRKLPEPPTLEELLEMLYDLWDQSGFRDLPREEQLRYYRQAQRVLRRFHERAAPRYHLPVATEAWFEMPVGEQALVTGSIDRVDLVDGQLQVVDYKTNKRAKARQHVAGSLQLSIYALACEHLYGRLPASVSLDFVVPGIEIRVLLDELDLDAARVRIDRAAARVLAAAYEPTPNRLCGWCDFRSLCPAWPDEGGSGLGELVAEAAQRRRALGRAVRDLRRLEAGIERLRAELGDAGPPPPAGPVDQEPG